MIYIQLTICFALLAYAGLFSFGTAGFFGIGAYVSVLVSLHFGVPIMVGALAGLLFSAGVSLVIAAITVRLKGLYFALALFAFTAVAQEMVYYLPEGIAGGATGVFGIQTLPTVELFYLGIGILGFTALVAWYITGHSRFSLLLTALRNDEALLRTLGTDTFRLRVFVTVVYGSMVSLMGMYYVRYLGILDPTDVFGAKYNLQPMVMGLLGGSSNLIGPIISSIGLYAFDKSLLAQYLPSYSDFFYGFLLLLVVYLLPRGLSEVIGRRLRRHDPAQGPSHQE